MNVSNKIRLLGVLGTSVYFSLPASAQVAPEAGQALRDAQSEQLTLPQRQQLPLDIRAEDTIDQTSSASNISLQVNRVDIEGNQVISTDDLQSVLAGLTGQITLAQLQVGAAKVRQYYRDQGYPLVLSYIPAQEITDGVVKLMVVEGRYGDIKIHNNSGLHASVAQPLDLLRQGEIVTSSSLEKSLLLINEQPGVSARSVLRAGSVNGTSDLDVTISKTKSVSGAVYADNYGNKYTGQYRVGGTLNVLSPLNRGDQLNLNILGTNEAQYFGGVSYQIPVNRWGTQIGAGYSYLDYQLGDSFKALDATGSAASTKVFLTQPVILQRDKRLSLGLQFENKDLRDQMKVVGTSSTKSIKLVTASVDGTVYDTILGGGVTRAMLAVKFGDLSLDSANDRITDNLSAKTAGHFKTLSLTLLRLQRLNDQWSLYANIQGQLSDKNLSSSEKLSLGGAYGVRAYPQGEAVGDIGVLGNLELRYQINPMWQTLAFVDAGTVRINKSRWDNTGTNHRSLSAAGIGAKMQIRGLTLDATLAYRLSSSEKAVSDNSDDSYRFWLRSMWQF